MTNDTNPSEQVNTHEKKEMIGSTQGKGTPRIASSRAYAAIASVLIAGVTAILGVASYLETNRRNADAKIFETKKPFFDKQILFYVDAIETVSKLATDAAPSQEDLDHFWQIYYGRLAAVEDEWVAGAMVVFGNKLKARASSDCIHKSSLLLAHCVKKSWEMTWKVELGPPPSTPCEAASFQQIRECN